MKRASAERRLIAVVVDTIATQALATPLLIFAAGHVLIALFFVFLVPCTDGKSQAEADQAIQRATMILAIDVVIVAVYSLMDIVLAGTPGKRFGYMQIRSADGSPAAVSQLLIRWTCRNTWLMCYLVAVLIAWQTGEGFESRSSAIFIWLARLLGMMTFAGFLMVLGPHEASLYNYIAGTNVFRVDLRDDPTEPSASKTRASAEQSAAEVSEFGVLRDVIDCRQNDDDDLEDVEIIEE